MNGWGFISDPTRELTTLPDSLKPVHTVAEKCDSLLQKSETVTEKWDCHRKVRLSHEFRSCLAVFGDSLTFLRQCGQGFSQLEEG